MYKSLLQYCKCNNCSSNNICFFRRIPLHHYPEYVQSFAMCMPRTIFKYERQWYADYKAIQEQLVQYYDLNNCKLFQNEQNYLTIEAQKESDRQRIKELFKQFLDIAAKATEDKNPEISIMFDEIGFVLATDYMEAITKIFSMFKTYEKINTKFFSGCNNFWTYS